jgi:hypothetical protein
MEIAPSPRKPLTCWIYSLSGRSLVGLPIVYNKKRCAVQVHWIGIINSSVVLLVLFLMLANILLTIFGFNHKTEAGNDDAGTPHFHNDPRQRLRPSDLTVGACL